MNIIKYINPRTGEKKQGKVRQGGYEIPRSLRFYPTMTQLDLHMTKRGFVRAGIRWGRGATQLQGPGHQTKLTPWQNFKALFRRKRQEKLAAV